MFASFAAKFLKRVNDFDFLYFSLFHKLPYDLFNNIQFFRTRPTVEPEGDYTSLLFGSHSHYRLTLPRLSRKKKRMLDHYVIT